MMKWVLLTHFDPTEPRGGPEPVSVLGVDDHPDPAIAGVGDRVGPVLLVQVLEHPHQAGEIHLLAIAVPLDDNSVHASTANDFADPVLNPGALLIRTRYSAAVFVVGHVVVHIHLP